jgi:hypothetical protein
MTVTTSYFRRHLSLVTLLAAWVTSMSATSISFADGYQGQRILHSKNNNNNNIIQHWTQQLQKGYKRRVRADPSFSSKSITEVIVAAGTQFAAEWNRRGADRILPEIDFIIPAILTAVFGKYYRYVLTPKRRHNAHSTPPPYPRVFVKFLKEPFFLPWPYQSRCLWNNRLCCELLLG